MPSEESQEELMPDETHREGLDPITYAEGFFAALVTLAVMEFAGWTLSMEQLLIVGGIGVLGCFLWEYKYE